MTSLPDWHDPLVRAYRQWGYMQADFDPLQRIRRGFTGHAGIARTRAAGADRIDRHARGHLVFDQHIGGRPAPVLVLLGNAGWGISLIGKRKRFKFH